MTLKEFKDVIQKAPKNFIFPIGVSEPFSWRGYYSDVAFTVVEESMSKETILERIKMAYKNEYRGYKGGIYKYNDNTPVHFEMSQSTFSDGEYIESFLVGENIYPETDREHMFVTKYFKK